MDRTDAEMAIELTGAGRDGGDASDAVLAEWVEPRLPELFTRWFPYHVGLQRATSAAVIGAANVQPGGVILDVGSGAGIPALELARRVGPLGRVMATDPSDVFVAAVLANAETAGLTNLEAMRTSVTAMPFEAERFDAVTCHMGVMFFQDVAGGLARIREVLRPDGRAGFVVWGPEAENLFFRSFWEAVEPYQPVAAEDDGAGDADDAIGQLDAPGPMRFAMEGSLGAALRAAGFADVREETLVVEMVWPGRVETLREQWLDLTGIGGRIPAERRADFERDVLAGLNRYADGETVRLAAAVVVASGAA